ncbi:MAG: C39 family peptidase [Clostridiales bacterium]|nr:C39 family peptidase [Clostridiales bacterium]
MTKKKSRKIQKKMIKRQKRRQRRRKIFKCIFAVAVCLVLVITVSGFVRGRISRNPDIPESLLEFAEKYPEAEKFVSDYPKKGNKDFNMDVSHEVKSGEIPLFIQWDERWGYKYYGDDFLAMTGCGPTCMSMVVCGLTGDTEWNSYEMACFAEEQGYYVDGVGTSWSLMTTGAEYFGLSATTGTVSESYIRDNLSESTPIICSVGPGDFTYSGHFIVLTGIDSDGNVIVNDPNSRKNSEKHWALEELVPQIKSLWIYGYDI